MGASEFLGLQAVFAVAVTALSWLFSRCRAAFIAWLFLAYSFSLGIQELPPIVLALSLLSAGLLLLLAPERRLFRWSTIIWIGLAVLGALGTSTILLSEGIQGWPLGVTTASLAFWGAGAVWVRVTQERGGSWTEPLLLSLLLGGAFVGWTVDRDPRAFSPAGLACVLLVLSCLCLVSLVLHSFRLAYIDELTEIPGRRALVEALEDPGSVYTLAMLDVDHFKKFNDTHGHEVGDQVLRLVAARIATVGVGGTAYRYGGEEFTLLFPGKGVEEVHEELDRLRCLVEASPLFLRSEKRPTKAPKSSVRRASKKGKASAKAPSVGVTVSIGVATNRTSESWQKVMKRADQALYRAKEAGRNQVERAS